MIGNIIIGENITELQYRDLDKISYSTLSSIDRDMHYALKKKFIPSDGTKFGILTESLLFNDYNPEEYYILNDSIIGDGKLKTACDMMFPKIIENVEILEESLNKYINEIIFILDENKIDYWEKKDSKWRAQKIISEAKPYWVEYVKGLGKIIITSKMYLDAKQAVLTLTTHNFTRGIFSTNSFLNIEKFSQVKICFNYAGYEFKSMLDWLIIDHDNKIIKPYDLKTGAGSADNFEKSYFHWRYDIQAFLYSKAICALRDRDYPDYKVDDFKFVYISRKNV